MAGTPLEIVFDAVRTAIASGKSDRLEAAEAQLRQALSDLQCERPQEAALFDDPASVLESCQRLDALLRSGSDFYSGLAAVVKVQLHGYGTAATSDQPQSGRRFALEG